MRDKQINIEPLEVRERVICALLDEIERLPEGTRYGSRVFTDLADGVRKRLGDNSITDRLVRERVSDLFMFALVAEDGKGLRITTHGREAQQGLAAKYSAAKPRTQSTQ
ncbi:MAG: hypothetical protein M1158_01760 [Candidatus Marsarchaeota archaeon]|nr:hypothetical protein [Candidatus Marsarchaeota archaeon]